MTVLKEVKLAFYRQIEIGAVSKKNNLSSNRYIFLKKKTFIRLNFIENVGKSEKGAEPRRDPRGA